MTGSSPESNGCKIGHASLTHVGDLNDRHFTREQWMCCSFRYKEVSIMVEFWTRLHQPDAILMLFVAVLCLAVHAYPGFSGYRTSRKGFWWVLYLIVGILALIEWIILVIPIT